MSRFSTCRSVGSTLGAIVLLCLSGCQTLAGSVSGKRYTAADGVFSLPLPELGAGFVIEDEAVRGPSGAPSGYVTFSDDFGRVRSIQYEVLDEQGRAKLKEDLAKGGSVVQHNLGAYLREVALPYADSICPGTRLIYERPMSLRTGEPAYLGVLEIPQGSPTMVFDSEHPDGRRMDSTRAHMLTIHSDVLLVLSAANDLDRVLGKPQTSEASVQPANWEPLVDTLVQLFESLSFER